MKKLFFLVAGFLLVLSVVVNAQVAQNDWLLSGHIAFDSHGYEYEVDGASWDADYTDISVAALKLIKPQIALGGLIRRVDNDGNETNVLIGEGRYILNPDAQFNPYGTVGFGTLEISDADGTVLRFGAGGMYFINDYLAIDFGLALWSGTLDADGVDVDFKDTNIFGGLTIKFNK